MPDLWHLAESIVLLALSAWAARMQARQTKITEMSERLVRLEVRVEAHDEGMTALRGELGGLREGLSDVRENMVRRHDFEELRRDLTRLT